MAIATHAGVIQEQSVGLMIHGLVQTHLGNMKDGMEAATRAHELAEEGGDRA
jgi:hypothetical protein